MKQVWKQRIDAERKRQRDEQREFYRQLDERMRAAYLASEQPDPNDLAVALAA